MGWARVVALSVVATVLVPLGVGRVQAFAGPVLVALWLGGRLLRYAGLVRLGVG